MPSKHLILYRPLLLLPSIFPNIRVFSNESALCIRWPKYWSFNFNISPANEHPGLISFRMDWLDLLAVQGTLKSLLQLHCSKALVFLCSAFFIKQGTAEIRHFLLLCDLQIFDQIFIFYHVYESESVSHSVVTPWTVASVHGILQSRILEWVVIPFSRESSRPRDRTQVSHVAGRFFTVSHQKSSTNQIVSNSS